MAQNGETKSARRAVRAQFQPKLDKPDWAVWASIPNAELWEAVALASNIDPNSLIAWLNARPLSNTTLANFHNCLREAIAGLTVNGGELPSLSQSENHRLIRVELGDFRVWACSRGWKLPMSFPDFPAKKPPQELPNERKARLSRLVDAEIRKGKTKTEAIAIVASAEPSHRAKHDGDSISPETLRKILQRK